MQLPQKLGSWELLLPLAIVETLQSPRLAWGQGDCCGVALPRPPQPPARCRGVFAEHSFPHSRCRRGAVAAGDVLAPGGGSRSSSVFREVTEEPETKHRGGARGPCRDAHAVLTPSNASRRGWSQGTLGSWGSCEVFP